jgi:hypothetical protein
LDSQPGGELGDDQTSQEERSEKVAADHAGNLEGRGVRVFERGAWVGQLRGVGGDDKQRAAE